MVTSFNYSKEHGTSPLIMIKLAFMINYPFLNILVFTH